MVTARRRRYPTARRFLDGASCTGTATLLADQSAKPENVLNVAASDRVQNAAGRVYIASFDTNG